MYTRFCQRFFYFGGILYTCNSENRYLNSRKQLKMLIMNE